MLLPIAGIISILILFITTYMLCKEKTLKSDVRLGYIGVFSSLLIIYVSEVYLYLIDYNIKISEYVLKINISFYMIFGMSNAYLTLISVFRKREEIEKRALPLFIYFILLLSTIGIIWLIPFKKDIFYTPQIRYQLYFYFVFLIILLYPLYLMISSSEKKRVDIHLAIFSLFFFFALFLAFISFILLFQLKQNYFWVIYIPQSLFVLSAFYHYKDIEIIEIEEKIEEKIAEKIEEKREEKKIKFGYGDIYLINEKIPNQIYALFRGMKKKSLLITRKFPENLKKEIGDGNFIWMSGIKDAKFDTIGPTNLAELLNTIKIFTDEEEKRIIFIDDLNFLIFQNGFHSVYKIINSIYEVIITNNAIVFISIDMAQLEKNEVVMLERECEVINWKS